MVIITILGQLSRILKLIAPFTYFAHINQNVRNNAHINHNVRNNAHINHNVCNNLLFCTRMTCGFHEATLIGYLYLKCYLTCLIKDDIMSDTKVFLHQY